MTDLNFFLSECRIVIVMHNNCYHLIMVSVIVLWQRTNYVVDRYIQLCTFTDSMELYNF